MMKYRILTDEELVHFSEDLKQFLIINGVHSEEWEQMNKTEHSKAIKLVELFSDSVLQRVYEKINFLELRKEDACFVFQFEKDKMNLVNFQRKANSSVDLSTPELIHDALLNHIAELDFYTSSKPYNKSREEELHSLIEQGCTVSSKDFWEVLKEIISA